MKTLKNFDNSKHLLKYDAMDTLHKEFLDIYNSVDCKSCESFIRKLKVLYEHTKLHFKEEEELMDRYNYPTVREHKDEHAKVLHEIQYFLDRSHSIIGKKLLKSYYLEKLPEWFDLHLLSMDSDLSSFLKKTKSK